MTTTTFDPAQNVQSVPDSIVRALRQIVRRARLVILLRGVLAVAAVGVASLLAAMAVDWSVTIFSAWPRWALSLSALGLTVLAALWFLLRPLARSFTLPGIARAIENRHPELHERISSAIELLSSEDAPELRGSDALIAALAIEATGDARSVQARREVTFRPVRPFVFAAGAGLAVMAALFLIKPDDTRRLLHRAIAPFQNIPNVNDWQLVIRPGDSVRAVGDRLTVEVDVRNRAVDAAEFRLESPGGDQVTAMSPLPTSDANVRRFALTTEALTGDLRYRVHAGDALSRYYQVRVVPRPTVVQREIFYRYPAYTHRPAGAGEDATGVIRAVAGTEVVLTVHSSTPLESAEMLVDGESFTKGTVSAQPNGHEAGTACTFRFALPAELNGTYTLQLNGKPFASTTEPLAIEATADGKPLVRVTAPEQISLRLNPQDTLPITYAASDYFGISALELLVTVDGQALPPRPLPLDANAGPTPRAAAGVTRLDLTEIGLSAAGRATFQIRVADNLPLDLGGPQAGYSRLFSIEPDVQAASYARQFVLAEEIVLREALVVVLAHLRKAKEESAPLAKSLQKVVEANSPEPLSQANFHRVDAIHDELAPADAAIREVVLRMSGGTYASIAGKLTDLADLHLAKADNIVLQIKLVDTPQRRSGLADEADFQIDRAIGIVTEMLKDLSVLSEMLKQAQETQDLASEQEKLAADLEALLEAMRQQAQNGDANSAGGQSGSGEQMSPEELQKQMEEWEKRQAELSRRMGEMIRQSPQAYQQQMGREGQRVRDLVAVAQDLAKKQGALADLTKRVVPVVQADQDLRQLAAKQAELAKQAVGQLPDSDANEALSSAARRLAAGDSNALADQVRAEQKLRGDNDRLTREVAGHDLARQAEGLAAATQNLSNAAAQHAKAHNDAKGAAAQADAESKQAKAASDAAARQRDTELNRLRGEQAKLLAQDQGLEKSFGENPLTTSARGPKPAGEMKAAQDNFQPDKLPAGVQHAARAAQQAQQLAQQSAQDAARAADTGNVDRAVTNAENARKTVGEQLDKAVQDAKDAQAALTKADQAARDAESAAQAAEKKAQEAKAAADQAAGKDDAPAKQQAAQAAAAEAQKARQAAEAAKQAAAQAKQTDQQRAAAIDPAKAKIAPADKALADARKAQADHKAHAAAAKDLAEKAKALADAQHALAQAAQQLASGPAAQADQQAKAALTAEQRKDQYLKQAQQAADRLPSLLGTQKQLLDQAGKLPQLAEAATPEAKQAVAQNNPAGVLDQTGKALEAKDPAASEARAKQAAEVADRLARALREAESKRSDAAEAARQANDALAAAQKAMEQAAAARQAAEQALAALRQAADAQRKLNDARKRHQDLSAKADALKAAQQQKKSADDELTKADTDAKGKADAATKADQAAAQAAKEAQQAAAAKADDAQAKQQASEAAKQAAQAAHQAADEAKKSAEAARQKAQQAAAAEQQATREHQSAAQVAARPPGVADSEKDAAAKQAEAQKLAAAADQAEKDADAAVAEARKQLAASSAAADKADAKNPAAATARKANELIEQAAAAHNAARDARKALADAEAKALAAETDAKPDAPQLRQAANQARQNADNTWRQDEAALRNAAAHANAANQQAYQANAQQRNARAGQAAVAKSLADQQQALAKQTTERNQQLRQLDDALSAEQLRLVTEEQAKLGREVAEITDRVKKYAPQTDRLDTKAARASMSAADLSSSPAKLAAAAVDANRAAGLIEQLAGRVAAGMTGPGEFAPPRPAAPAGTDANVRVEGSTDQHPEQVAEELNEYEGQLQREALQKDLEALAERQKLAAAALEALGQKKVQRLLPPHQSHLTRATDGLADDVDLIRLHAEDLIPDAAGRAELAKAVEQVAAAGAAQRTAQPPLEAGTPAPAEGPQRAAAGNLAAAAVALEALGKRMADLAKGAEPNEDETTGHLMDAFDASQEARKKQEVDDAERAAQLLWKLANLMSNEAQSMGLDPSAGMQGMMGMMMMPGSGGGTGFTGPGFDLTPDQLAQLGIDARQWGMLPGELRNPILQGMAEEGPPEYRDLIKRYFQALAAQDSGGAAAGTTEPTKGQETKP